MAVVGGCSALGGDVASRVAEPSEEREPTSAGASDGVFASHVEVGDCLAEPTTYVADAEEVIETVRTTSCLDEHAEEVYDAVTILEREFPGNDAIGARAYFGCLERFEPFVGVSYQESLIEIGFLTPTEESWDFGDRTVQCTLYHPEGEQLTGSLHNAHDVSLRLRDRETGKVAEETAVEWLKIVPGDCIKAASETTDDFRETLVPCEELHSDEVYGQFELSGDEYPGDDEVEALADAGCTERFDEFVGQAYADSPLDFYYYSPYEESWQGGDRLVQCRIFDPEGDVTGTLRGAGVQST
jgi:Septum formation